MLKFIFFTFLAIWVLYKLVLQPKRTFFSVDDMHERRKEGDVNIDYMPPKGKSKSDDEGEYVDFEEIK